MIRNQTNRLPRRGGFSLVELLTVIAILALLTALTVSVVNSVRNTATSKTNEETLTKLQGALDTQGRAVGESVRKMRISRTTEFTNLVSFCGGDEDRAEALALHLHLKKEMPQTFAEANLATGTFPLAGNTYAPRLTFRSVAGVTGPPELQAAVLLYLNLNEKAAGSTDGFQADLVGQGDVVLQNAAGQPVTFRVFTDVWGTPITFVRHLQNSELTLAQYANAKGVSQNPLDPKGKLAAQWPAPANQALAFQALNIGSGSYPFVVPQFSTQNQVTTVVSAGPQKNATGARAFESFAGLDGWKTSDDVYPYRLKKQGARAD